MPKRSFFLFFCYTSPMTSQKTTLYIDSDAPHLSEAIAPFLKDNIPNLTIVDQGAALLHLTVKSGKITIKQKNTPEETSFATPIRVMTLIQHIQKAAQECSPIYIGPYILNYGARTLTENDTVLHLTEKEVEVLIYLDQNRGKGITRDDLLKNVWGYADGIDTHTIETHIYRLRQKIEKDSDDAAILLTQDDGYHLVGNS